MAQFHTQRLTSAAALSPPTLGMYLVKVTVLGGATPGAFSINYDGSANAFFASPSDGTNGRHEYAVNWPLPGTSVPAASIGFDGGISAVILTYSDQPNKGAPSIDNFRAVRGTHTFAGSGTNSLTLTYDQGPASPTGILILQEASAGRVTFPTVGAYTDSPEASIQPFLPMVASVPDLQPTNTLTVTQTADGAATQDVILYY